MSPEGAEFLTGSTAAFCTFQPLRKLKDRIPAQINSSLSRLNASRPYPVLGLNRRPSICCSPFPGPIITPSSSGYWRS